jgi:ankyrin repeat protein
MTREWQDAVRRGAIDELQRLLAAGTDVDSRDEHGQTALMLAAAEGQGHVVTWLVERGAALDHRAKYGLSAVMLAVIRGHVDVVRTLTAAGADLGLRGTGALGFAGHTALDLARARDAQEMVEILARVHPTRSGPSS